MLLTPLLHPEISAVLAAAGHHSKVLIADGNYPASTTLGPNAKLVSSESLARRRNGHPRSLRALVASRFRSRWPNTMMYETTGPYALEADPPVWEEYRAGVQHKPSCRWYRSNPIEKWDFYPAVCTSGSGPYDPDGRSAAFCQFACSRSACRMD